MSVLTGPFLPDWLATIVSSALVIGLSAMILIGWHRQAAALVLALSLFWASYLAMMSAPDQQLGAFWRDLALIGALVMTYADGNQSRPAVAGKAETSTDDRPRSRISQAIATTRSAISRPSARVASAGNSEKKELYRKDLDIVRAS